MLQGLLDEGSSTLLCEMLCAAYYSIQSTLRYMYSLFPSHLLSTTEYNYPSIERGRQTVGLGRGCKEYRVIDLRICVYQVTPRQYSSCDIHKFLNRTTRTIKRTRYLKSGRSWQRFFCKKSERRANIQILIAYSLELFGR